MELLKPHCLLIQVFQSNFSFSTGHSSTAVVCIVKYLSIYTNAVKINGLLKTQISCYIEIEQLLVFIWKKKKKVLLFYKNHVGFFGRDLPFKPSSISCILKYCFRHISYSSVGDIFTDNLQKIRDQHLVYQRKIIILSTLRCSRILEKPHRDKFSLLFCRICHNWTEHYEVCGSFHWYSALIFFLRDAIQLFLN